MDKKFNPKEIDTGSSFNPADWEFSSISVEEQKVYHRVGTLFRRYLDAYREQCEGIHFELNMMVLMNEDWQDQRLTDREFCLLIDHILCW